MTTFEGTEPPVVSLADADARALITWHGLDRSLFVEAGAGTGKTSQLVGRVTNLVLEHGVSLADVAAITFTEAAAAELQERIRTEFDRRSLDADDPAIVERCRQAVADADRAAITTLHGFAKRILSEHAVAAGLPPRVEILDEISSQIAWEDRWARFVDRLHADPANEELLLRAAALNIPVEPTYRRGTSKTFKEVAAQLDQSWDRIEALRDITLGDLAPIDVAPIRSALAEVDALLERCTDPTDGLYLKVLDKTHPLRAVCTSDDPLRQLPTLCSFEMRVRGSGRKGNWPDGSKESMFDAVDVLVERVADVVAATQEPVLRQILTLTAQEVLATADERRLDGRLEFHDLLVLAKKLLRTNPYVRSRLHERYSHLLLDEFQDTDPIQIELAVLIAGNATGPFDGNWSDIDIDPGRVFFVGDPKQSIYRFRRADIELFLAAQNRFGTGVDGVRLDTNFRTVPSVLAWINALFGTLMPEPVAGMQPEYAPLHAARTDSPTGDHRPILFGEPHDKDVSAGAIRDAEAADVAGIIGHIRAEPDQWPVFDRQLDRWRAARLSDVTILVPARTSLPQLRRALDAARIPYRLATGTLVYDSQEIRDAMAALRAVDDPTDLLSLVAALRSPLYACSDVDLFTFHHAGGRFDYTAPVPTDLDSHPVADAFADLAERHERRWWERPADQLDALIRERMLPVLAFAGDGAADALRRLRFVVDQARQFEESDGAGLRAFCEWTELQSADAARVHEPILPETDDESVRIMTVHGSKGLEFPITILSGLSTVKAGRRDVMQVVFDGDTPEIKVRKGLTTGMHEPRADLEEIMDEHEKRRLFYVAATRARDHLAVSCHHKVGRESDGQMVHDWAPSVGDRCRRWDGADAPTIVAPSLREVSTSPDLARPRAEWIAERAAVLAEGARHKTTSATALARRLAPDVVFHDDEPGQTIDDSASPAPRPGGSGLAFGSAVHETLQMVDLRGDDRLDELARLHAVRHGVADAADAVARAARLALTAPAVVEAAGTSHHKEVFVASPIGAELLEGYVDLLYERADELVIVDYKTDRTPTLTVAEDRAARYRYQGAAYAVAVEQTTGRRVAEVRFVFCAGPEAFDVAIGDLEAAKRDIGDALGA